MVNFVVDLGIVEGRLEADLQDVREVVSKTMKRFSRSKYGLLRSTTTETRKKRPPWMELFLHSFIFFFHLNSFTPPRWTVCNCAGTKVGLSFKNFLGAMIDILQLNSEKDHVQRPWSMEDFLSRTSEIYFRGEVRLVFSSVGGCWQEVRETPCVVLHL